MVLYVEDEENDILLLDRAIRRAGMAVALRSVSDGAQAIDYLAGSGPYADREQHPLPRLVLLDLNLPRISGFEVLQWVRTQPQFASLRIVVCTSSGRAEDKTNALQLGAAQYIIKSAGFEEMVQAIRDAEAAP